jgi:predicted dehydrogenase
VGCGGRGNEQLGEISSEDIVAMCDVDEKQGASGFGKFPSVKKYKDFRKMFDEMEKGIDAVLVATPDHTHAVIAMAAIKRGKHVYCEKPLAHSIGEVRALGKAAKEFKVVTQMGNQGHSYDSCAMTVEWVRAGAIGKISEVHCTCDGCYSAIGEHTKVNDPHDVPATLDWDLWLGPAMKRPYNPMYLPGKWRHWYPFGTSTAGDWVCHVVDPAFWALDLKYPTSIQTEVKDFDPKEHFDTFPRGNHTIFEFPAKGDRGPVTLHWYEGTIFMPRPANLGDRKLVSPCGFMVGEEGAGICWGSHGAAGVRIYPEAKMQEFAPHRPAPTIKRAGEHHKDWINAIKTGGKAGSDFADYAGPLAEVALLTVIGGRFAGQKLLWDGEKGQFTNNADANKMLMSPYREGWTL